MGNPSLSEKNSSDFEIYYPKIIRCHFLCGLRYNWIVTSWALMRRPSGPQFTNHLSMTVPIQFNIYIYSIGLELYIYCNSIVVTRWQQTSCSSHYFRIWTETHDPLFHRLRIAFSIFAVSLYHGCDVKHVLWNTYIVSSCFASLWLYCELMVDSCQSLIEIPQDCFTGTGVIHK